MTLRFGTDGVRGRVPDELHPEFVVALGRAATDVLGGGTWLIAGDTRQSSPSLMAAFAHGVRAAGADVELLGVLPTPALAWAAQHADRRAAMVTASHNPWHDNGVKIFAAGGTKLSDDVEADIEERFAEALIDHDYGVDSVAAQGDSSLQQQWADNYVRHIEALGARLDGLRVVLDAANGAMYRVAPAAFRQLDAELVVINDQPDGRNINRQCGATDVSGLARAVVEAGADLGLAFDGDGDRVIAVDHLGGVVDGDRLIALAAQQLRAEGKLAGNTVVVTVMSNLGFHKAMDEAGIHVRTTAVGDRYVLEALDAERFSVGGEQSGHIIFRDLATTGDGLLAGVRLASYMRSTGRTLRDLARSAMTSYPQVLLNVPVAERHPLVADELAAEIEAVETFLAGQGRVVLRPSGTEPLIRVMVEAPTVDAADAAARRLAAVVAERFG
jgi:phosphoglucosamine mutase